MCTPKTVLLSSVTWGAQFSSQQPSPVAACQGHPEEWNMFGGREKFIDWLLELIGMGASCLSWRQDPITPGRRGEGFPAWARKCEFCSHPIRRTDVSDLSSVDGGAWQAWLASAHRVQALTLFHQRCFGFEQEYSVSSPCFSSLSFQFPESLEKRSVVPTCWNFFVSSMSRAAFLPNHFYLLFIVSKFSVDTKIVIVMGCHAMLP